MTYAADLEFILTECLQYAKMEPRKLLRLPFQEVLTFLPHPSGRGQLVCGAIAYQRIYDVAERALSRSPYAGRIDREAVMIRST